MNHLATFESKAWVIPDLQGHHLRGAFECGIHFHEWGKQCLAFGDFGFSRFRHFGGLSLVLLGQFLNVIFYFVTIIFTDFLGFFFGVRRFVCVSTDVP